MKFFDDLRVGDKVEVGRHTFTAMTIKSFAARFDPQPFHLDEAAAESSAPPAGIPPASGCGC
jgi:acyl dehydratase